MIIRALVLQLAAAGLLSAQLHDNTLTVTATRIVYPQPDQVVFTINVTAGADSTLDDVVALLAGTGVTAKDFTGAGQNPSGSSPRWTFTLVARIPALNDTIEALQAAPDPVTFALQGTQVSSGLRASACAEPDLIADAKAQGAKLASAAGRSLGPVLAISNAAVGIPTAAYRIGDFGSFLSVGVIASGPLFLPVTCSVTVEFELQA